MSLFSKPQALEAVPPPAFQHVVDNLFWSPPSGPLGRRELAAAYRLPMVNYGTLSPVDKFKEMGALSRLIEECETDGCLYRLNRFYSLDAYLEEAGRHMYHRYADHARWQELLHHQADALEGLSPWEPQLFVMLILRDEDGQGITRLADEVRRTQSIVEHHLGIASELPLPATEVERGRQLSQSLLGRLRGIMDDTVRPITTRELYWWLARQDTFPISEPVSEEHFELRDAIEIDRTDGTEAWAPNDHLIANLAGAPVDSRPHNYVVVEGPLGKIYSTTLILGELPKQITWPQQEAELLSAPLDAVGFPVDAMLPWTWQSNQDARATANRGAYDTEQQAQDEAEGAVGGVSRRTSAKAARAEQLTAELTSPPYPPRIFARARFRVACGVPADVADDIDGPATLRRQVRSLKTSFGAVNLHQPSWLQLLLHYDWLPRTRATARRFDQWMSPLQVGAMMPHATDVCGDESGVVVGHTMSGNRPVKYAIGAASATDLPPTILLAGMLGAGKTMTLSMLLHQAVLQGALVGDLDPKPDHKFHLSEDLKDKVSRLEINETTTDATGLMDPMRCALDEERVSMTSLFLTRILALQPRDKQLEIGLIEEHAARCAHEERYSCRAIIQALQETANRSPDDERGRAAMMLAAALQAKTATIAKLAFADAGNQELGYDATRPLTTMVMPALKGASRNVGDDRTSQDYILDALMIATSTFLTALVTGERARWKVISWDEAWALLVLGLGHDLLGRLVRLGRSENITPIISTQNLADVPGDLAKLLGQVIVMRVSRAEAPIALRLLGLDPRDRQLAERISSERAFPSGRALWKDLHGRVSEVQFLPTKYLMSQYRTSIDAPDESQIVQVVKPA